MAWAPTFTILPETPTALAFEKLLPVKTFAAAASPVATKAVPVTPKTSVPLAIFPATKSASPTIEPEPL